MDCGVDDSNLLERAGVIISVSLEIDIYEKADFIWLNCHDWDAMQVFKRGVVEP